MFAAGITALIFLMFMLVAVVIAFGEYPEKGVADFMDVARTRRDLEEVVLMGKDFCDCSGECSYERRCCCE